MQAKKSKPATGEQIDKYFTKKYRVKGDKILRKLIKESIITEADILRKSHPSKDCRAFAEAVFNLLSSRA
jgi:hypothetical protein